MPDPTRTDDKRVDTYLTLLTAINNGIEDLLGAASRGVIFNQGVMEGRALGAAIQKTNTLPTAIDIVNQAYEGVWDVELYNNGDGSSVFFEDDLGQTSFRIIVRECPVRAAVTNKNLKQDGPLCHLSNGYLCGMLDEILGEKVGVSIEHAGPLACKKRMYFRK
ncbi:MAG: hypothetical protein ACW98Y_10085 [Candidatus Thorarchaeota archaeon]|jgi:predicted hydrocarbon binding protein